MNSTDMINPLSDAPPDDVKGAIDILLKSWKQVNRKEQQWQLEKAKLRARILQLEAESRRHHQIRLDLVRRVKLLEYGLISERKKFMQLSSKTIKNEKKFVVGSIEKKSNIERNRNKNYRSLPRNFFSSSDITNLSPGRAFLREYLIELGYLDEVKALDGRTSRFEQQFVNDLKTSKSKNVLDSNNANSNNINNDDDDNNNSKKISFAKPSKKPHGRGDISDALVKESIGDTKIWKTSASLRSHMDGVRCLSFHSTEAALLSGSEDGTMKLWNLGSVVEFVKARKQNPEPVYTFRGHRGILTSIDLDDSRNRIYSASTDGNIMIWQLPSLENDPYDNEGCSMKYALNTINEEKHTDAVWSICSHSEKELLFSASSDGTVAIWNVNNPMEIKRENSITSSFSGVPLSVKVAATDLNKLLIAYTSGEVALCDIETGKTIRVMNSESRITDLTVHPTLTLCMSAHVDSNIRIFDWDQGSCIATMQAHRDIVTSVSMDPSGLYMASAGHDESIRFWDVSARKCIQDLDGYQTHRHKFDEAIHVVAFHRTLPLVASGGGDSIVKIYQ